jgi:hypothetical protein
LGKTAIRAINAINRKSGIPFFDSSHNVGVFPIREVGPQQTVKVIDKPPESFRSKAALGRTASRSPFSDAAAHRPLVELRTVQGVVAHTSATIECLSVCS